MNVRNWKIGIRLGFGFALIQLMLIIASIISVTRLAAVNHETTLITEDRVPKVLLVEEIQTQMGIVARALRNTLLVKNQADTQKEFDRIMKARKAASGVYDELDKSLATPKGKQLFKELVVIRGPYSQGLEKFEKLVKAGKKDEAANLLMGDLRKAQTVYFDKLDELKVYVVDVMQKGSQEASRVYTTSRLILIAISVAAVVLGCIIAIFITRTITQPLREAVNVAETVASGDLTSQIEVRTKDETGQLMQALKNMNDSLLRIVAQVRLGTDTIATASSEIAAGNQDLSSRTEEQASSLEETASSMEEMTSTVRQNGESARQANQLAIAASDIAVKGGNVVAEVVTTMGGINESSKKMADIINVIDGIAFQTNILALNAAVEAARAGEQGRGFAVVATEVRNLAQRSASAAREIKTLIDDSVNKVEDGSRLVDQAGETMTEIVSSIQRVTDIMSEITAATHEQEDGIEQINQAISQMDQVTQQNAALVEEAAAAAESMQDQAGKLVEAVSVFRTGKHAQTASAPPGKTSSKKTGNPPVRPDTGKTKSLEAPQRPPQKLPNPGKPATGPKQEGDWEEF